MERALRAIPMGKKNWMFCWTELGARQYTSVRGLARGLQMLCALNAMENGRATSQQISDATGLHRTTVRRLLENGPAQE